MDLIESAASDLENYIAEFCPEVPERAQALARLSEAVELARKAQER